LSALVEEVRAPGAARAEVDALLAGLSQPPPADASRREHADLLLSLMEDAALADYTGSDGRTVRTAAIQALLALGYPYALELPPEALEARIREEGGIPGLLSTRKGQVGFGLVALAGIAQLSPVLYLLAQGMASWSDGIVILFLASIVGTTFLPAFLAVLGHNLGSRGLKKAGLGWLASVATFWLGGFALGFSEFPRNLIGLALGGLLLAGSFLMHSSKE
jgi:hypothetical protein